MVCPLIHTSGGHFLLIWECRSVRILQLGVFADFFFNSLCKRCCAMFLCRNVEQSRLCFCSCICESPFYYKCAMPVAAYFLDYDFQRLLEHDYVITAVPQRFRCRCYVLYNTSSQVRHLNRAITMSLSLVRHQRLIFLVAEYLLL